MQLIFQPNTKESRIIQIKGTAATIGSASENIVCLPTASPYHIGLFYLEGAWFADDISGNGFTHHATTPVCAKQHRPGHAAGSFGRSHVTFSKRNR